MRRYLALPEEILLRILMYLDEEDLYVLLHVNRQLRRLARDHILWHYIRYVRSPQRLTALLTRPNRPDRLSLARLHILRGLYIEHRIRDGRYIGSQLQQHVYEAQKAVLNSMKRRRLAVRLAQRPTIHELQSRCLMPDHVYVYGTTPPAIPIASTCLPYIMHNTTCFDSTPLATNIAYPAARVLHAVKHHADRKCTNLSGDKHDETIHTPEQSSPRTNLAVSEPSTSEKPIYPVVLCTSLQVDHYLHAMELRDRLAHRPPAEHIICTLHLMPDSAEAARLLCPAIRPRIHFYESLIK